jgi:GTP-binding protein
MNISSAVFLSSSPDLDSCPDESVPEFAFIGRSNVGKSSLLNFLSGKRDLAKVSPTPGHTKLINMFTINGRWRLVDLPGYGFAQVARKEKSKFNRAVNDYLENRPNLCCVFALIDGSLPPQAIDLEFVEWLADRSIPFVLVFTKADLVGPAALQANIEAFKEAIAEWCDGLPEVFSCSAKQLEGRTALLEVIDVALVEAEKGAAAEGEKAAKAKKSAAAGDASSKRKPGGSGSRPDRIRPW